MILERLTLKQGKTHCGQGLITDPTCHVVMDLNADLEQNQPSGAESNEMNVSLTSKYGRRSSAVSDVYSYSFGLHRQLDKEIRS